MTNFVPDHLIEAIADMYLSYDRAIDAGNKELQRACAAKLLDVQEHVHRAYGRSAAADIFTQARTRASYDYHHEWSK